VPSGSMGLAAAAGIPLLTLVVAVGASFAADRVQSLGPLDRAQVGALVLPLFLAVPTVMVATARRAHDPRTARNAVVVVAIAVTLTFAYIVGTETTSLFCTPVSGPAGLAFGLCVGTIVGSGFYVGSFGGARVTRGAGTAMGVVGQIIAVVIFALAALAGFAVIVATHPVRCALPG
jgi:hypothetical protein